MPVFVCLINIGRCSLKSFEAFQNFEGEIIMTLVTHELEMFYMFEINCCY